MEMSLTAMKAHVRAWYSYAFAAEVFSAVGIVSDGRHVYRWKEADTQAIFLPITLESKRAMIDHSGLGADVQKWRET
jgi:hypothetical protein